MVEQNNLWRERCKMLEAHITIMNDTYNELLVENKRLWVGLIKLQEIISNGIQPIEEIKMEFLPCTVCKEPYITWPKQSGLPCVCYLCASGQIKR